MIYIIYIAKYNYLKICLCELYNFFYCSDTENSEDEKYFYIDILHGGLLRSKNDCPRTRGRRCPIESFNKHNEISPTEVSI